MSERTQNETLEVMDVSKVALTLPKPAANEISRENMLLTLLDMLGADSEVVIVEGPEGIGKTTLLAQFARKMSQTTLSVFVRPSSRWAYNSDQLARDLCDQVGWVLERESYRTKREADPMQLLGLRIFDLQRQANRTGTTYYFVVDGLAEIPEEDSHEREQILDLLPFGLSGFRFLLSGPPAYLQERLRKLSEIGTFRLPVFALEETREFFSELVGDRHSLETVHKVCRGIPGKLASVWRLIKAGTAVSQLISDLPTLLPHLFELEWKVVSPTDVILRRSLATLAFDRRQHTLRSLADLCGTEVTNLRDRLSSCNFVECRGSDEQVSFVSEVFKNFAVSRLQPLRKEVLDAAIAEMLSSPENRASLMHLPGYLHEAGRYEDLINYLSPAHIGQLIDCSNSWAPLRQKASLGIETALEMKRDGDLLRFGLQSATIKTMESAEPWRSETEAYVATGDYSAAYALAQRMATKEDRLHLLAVIAKAKKAGSVEVELELTQQIVKLAEQLDWGNVGTKGVEIASDLFFSNPELALEIVQKSQKSATPDQGFEMAMAKMSIKAFTESQTAPALQDACETLRARVKDPNIKKFMDTVSVCLGRHSPERVLAEVSQWENPTDKIFALSVWAVVTTEKTGTAGVMEFALDTILKTPTYASNAKVFRELATPLLNLADMSERERLIGRFDGLKGAIEMTGPTEEYVRLQAILARATGGYDHRAALNRVEDVFLYVDGIKDLSTKVASLAILAGALKRLPNIKESSAGEGLNSELLQALQKSIHELLSNTADHYKAVSTAIPALARSDPSMAIGVATSLNTEPRRDSALVTLLEALADKASSESEFKELQIGYSKISSLVVRARAARLIVEALAGNKKDMAFLVPQFRTIFSWVKDIPDAEERFQSLLKLAEIMLTQTPRPADLLSQVTNALEETWGDIDVGWTKVDSGFQAATLLAVPFPELSKRFLSRTDLARNEIVLDCEDTGFTFIACVRLAIRCFAGLVERKLHAAHDMNELENLINRIPSASSRVAAWSELAIKCFLAGDNQLAHQTVVDKLRPLLELGVIRDTEALWRTTALAAPALHCATRPYAMQIILGIPQPYRDDALRQICVFLITKSSTFEPNDVLVYKSYRITYDDFLDLMEVMNHLDADHLNYSILESVVTGMEKRFRKEFIKSQIADVIAKLKAFAKSKFPNPRYIAHEGYYILAEAQIARLERPGSSFWDDLAGRAHALSNVADRAYVLTLLAATMAGYHLTKAKALFQDAKALIPMIPSLEDRLGRCEALAERAAQHDVGLSKEIMAVAWRETLPDGSSSLESRRRRIIDLAYRIDPDFASRLAAETDDDPARRTARHKTMQHLDALKARDRVLKDENTADCSDDEDDQLVEVASMLLAGLNANRVEPMSINRTRSFVQRAGKMDTPKAYAVLSWTTESVVRKYSDTDQAKTIIRPLFEAARLSAELAFRIAARIRSVSDIGIETARSTLNSDDNLVRQHEREKALSILRDWVASEASGFIKITDPYFGQEDLEIVRLIRAANPTIPIHVLTSRKHQLDSRVQAPWDEAYRTHWRLTVADSDPGDVKVTVVGKRSSGEHPIHDRWWLSERSGLRIGTSTNSLGAGKVSEVSQLDGNGIAEKLNEVDKYLSGSVRESGIDRLDYSSFSL